jgi:chromosome-anchoring protein RacA
VNTGAVSKLLGVSSSTVQRWVKHLGLEMERNEFGHYLYTEDDIEVLKDFKQQIQDGVPIQQIQVKKAKRRGSMKLQRRTGSDDILLERINRLEGSLDSKADSVVTYQLLQHRREIEELKAQIEKMNRQIEQLLENSNETKESTPDIPYDEVKKRKKKTVFRSLLGF